MSHKRGLSSSVQPSPYLSSSSTPLMGTPNMNLSQRSPFISSSPPNYSTTPKVDSAYAGPAHTATRDRLRWTTGPRRSRVRDFVAGKMGKGLIMAMLVLLGWELGWLSATAGGSTAPEPATAAAVESRPAKERRCDPYEQHGLLMVNTTSHAANRWKPFRTEAACQPVNYMDLLHGYPQHDQLEFIRDKTVLLMGDSVDRDHNEHFCGFVGGEFIFIDQDHTASPPPPPGVAPGGGNTQSRPYECYVARYNFRILSVFHFGFRPAHKEGEWLLNSPHFYEPSTPEDRFDQIARPLVKALGTHAVPDVFSFTSGFWDLMRQVFADDAELKGLYEAGTATDEDKARLDAWSEVKEEKLEWYAKHFERFVKKVVETWPGDKPRLLWRGLHRPKPFRNAPVHRVQAVDELGRSVVERLIREDRDARVELAKLDLAAVSLRQTKAAKQRTKSWLGKTRAEPLEDRAQDAARSAHELEKKRQALEAKILGTTPLGERMAINRWGSLIAGQERHFRDDVHPNGFPSSWLYGNTILHQLNLAVTGADLTNSGAVAV